MFFFDNFSIFKSTFAHFPIFPPNCNFYFIEQSEFLVFCSQRKIVLSTLGASITMTMMLAPHNNDYNTYHKLFSSYFTRLFVSETARSQRWCIQLTTSQHLNQAHYWYFLWLNWIEWKRSPTSCFCGSCGHFFFHFPAKYPHILINSSALMPRRPLFVIKSIIIFIEFAFKDSLKY